MLWLNRVRLSGATIAIVLAASALGDSQSQPGIEPISVANGDHKIVWEHTFDAGSFSSVVLGSQGDVLSVGKESRRGLIARYSREGDLLSASFVPQETSRLADSKIAFNDIARGGNKFGVVGFLQTTRREPFMYFNSEGLVFRVAENTATNKRSSLVLQTAQITGAPRPLADKPMTYSLEHVSTDHNLGMTAVGVEGYRIPDSGMYGFDQFPFVIRYDVSGNEMWRTSFRRSKPPIDRFYGVHLQSDGETILVGRASEAGPDTKSGVIIRMDAHGEEQWRNMLSTDGAQSISDVHVMEDGRMILVGHTSRLPHEGSQGWFAATDTLGKVISSKTIETSLSSQLIGVSKVAKNRYAALGRQTDKSGKLADSLIVEFDETLETTAHTVFGPPIYDLPKDMVALADGRLIVVGTRKMADDTYDAWILALELKQTENK